MADVARIAGVSVTTVSRALAGSELVTAATRGRIAAAVERTGYVVNNVAANLRTQRSRQILAMVPSISNPFFSRVLLGLEEELGKRGFSLLVGNTGNAPNREADLARQLLTGNVDGLVLLTGRVPELLGPARLNRTRIVAISERIPNDPIATVGIDNGAAAGAIVGHLRELGHHGIAHIAGPAGNVLTAQRRAGYEQALGASARPVVVGGDFTIASGEAAMGRLLRRGGRITAVFCSNDEMAIGAIKTAKAAGLRVPQDVSIAGFDDIEFAAAYDPALTTIRQPRHDMGRLAAVLLLEMLSGGNDGRRGLTLPHQLVVRASTAAAPSD